MSKKIFVVSDIHGYYTELINALDAVGFDKNNPNHIFVSCGDLFDRGNENHLVYSFVKGLKHKILLKGNHEDMLRRVLLSGRIDSNNVSNGTDITVTQLLGEDVVGKQGYINVSAYADKIEEIVTFIDSMLNFYETGRYIFVHGWVPIISEGRDAEINQAWRDVSDSEWKNARLIGWQETYNVGAIIEGKTIVCGHRPACLGHIFDSFREPDCSAPFYGKGVIAIDAGTVRSGRVNVLVVDECET